MKTTRKGNCITIFVLCFVFLSFLIPGFVLSMQEKQLEEQVFQREKKESKLDVEAEKIYLVKAIHEIRENSNSISVKQTQTVYTTKGQAEEFHLTELGKQMKKLEDLNILQEVGIDGKTRHTIASSTASYQSNNTQYFLGNIQLAIEKDAYEIVMESKTNKLLSIACTKGKLCENRTKQEILQSFIQYLDLYIIDDWKYEEGLIQSERNNNMWSCKISQMKSDKADLIVVLLENDEHDIIGIRTQGDLHQNGIEYVTTIPSVMVTEAGE